MPLVDRTSLLDALAAVAPGTGLREGIDRIMQASKGALIVISDQASVIEICSGGFLIDAVYTPQKLSELAKMDGAIILASDASRIARANVHLVPASGTPTSETGTRHRTAERVARSLGVPVVSVSEDMQAIKLYVGGDKHPLQPVARLLNQANQAVSTLERYRNRFDLVLGELTALEVEDLVTLRDVSATLQRSEMVQRIGDELLLSLVELGSEGRLIALQLDELIRNVAEIRSLLIRDYWVDRAEFTTADALGDLVALPTDDLVDLTTVATTLFPIGTELDLDTNMAPRGYRVLSRIPRLSETIRDRIVHHFGSLRKIMRATIDDLDDVEGVGEVRARAIKDGLTRIADTSMLERMN